MDDLAMFVHALADCLPEPNFAPDNQCFRYDKPDFRHFCLLRSCRVVSALYASVALSQLGFIQEICVLMRTVLEFCSQVDFVIASLDDNKRPTGRAARFIEDYFQDDYETRSADEKRYTLKQIEVHKLLGARLDNFIRSEKPSSAKMMSGSYIDFSNYVHGRHVESMDLYGGIPGRFHLYGMSRTPKDDEIIEILEVLIVTAELCFVGQHQALQLPGMVANDDIGRWYRRTMSDAQTR